MRLVRRYFPPGHLRNGLEVLDIINVLPKSCHHVLEHQEEPIKFLKSLWSLLKVEGSLWLTVPNMEQNLNWSPGHTMAYNSVLLAEHLRRACFNMEDSSFRVQRGHLRVRTRRLHSFPTCLPRPMQDQINETGRAESRILNNHDRRLPRQRPPKHGGV